MKIDNLDELYEIYFAGLYYLIVVRNDNGIAYFKVDSVSNLDNEDYIIDVLKTGWKWEVFKETLLNY